MFLLADPDLFVFCFFFSSRDKRFCANVLLRRVWWFIESSIGLHWCSSTSFQSFLISIQLPRSAMSLREFLGIFALLHCIIFMILCFGISWMLIVCDSTVYSPSKPPSKKTHLKKTTECLSIIVELKHVAISFAAILLEIRNNKIHKFISIWFDQQVWYLKWNHIAKITECIEIDDIGPHSIDRSRRNWYW